MPIKSIIEASSEAVLSTSRPETFRLPKPNSGGDPYFHFTRSFYYRRENNREALYDEAGNVIETHEHKGGFREAS